MSKIIIYSYINQIIKNIHHSEQIWAFLINWIIAKSNIFSA